MTKDFKEIDVPNPERGLSDKQRDRLRIDMADGINYLGISMKSLNGKINRHEREIYGDKNYEGLKSMTHSNSRLINWIVKALITVGVVGGMGFGILTVTGGV